LDWAKATKAADVVRETVWRWREDPEFETAIQRIMSFGIDDLGIGGTESWQERKYRDDKILSSGASTRAVWL
jgi:hypothetical protein